MMNQLIDAAKKLKAAEELKFAIGEVMTDEQSVACSKILDTDPGRYQRWLKTDTGRAATRIYIDAFLNDK